MKHVVVRNENAHTHVSNSNVRGGEMSTSEINVSELERDLSAQVSGEVRFDHGSRALYATDSSNYRQVPVGVAIPKDISDVIETVKKTIPKQRTQKAPTLSRRGCVRQL